MVCVFAKINMKVFFMVCVLTDRVIKWKVYIKINICTSLKDHILNPLCNGPSRYLKTTYVHMICKAILYTYLFSIYHCWNQMVFSKVKMMPGLNISRFKRDRLNNKFHTARVFSFLLLIN